MILYNFDSHFIYGILIKQINPIEMHPIITKTRIFNPIEKATIIPYETSIPPNNINKIGRDKTIHIIVFS
jgi:hypothetical protein